MYSACRWSFVLLYLHFNFKDFAVVVSSYVPTGERVLLERERESIAHWTVRSSFVNQMTHKRFYPWSTSTDKNTSTHRPVDPITPLLAHPFTVAGHSIWHALIHLWVHISYYMMSLWFTPHSHNQATPNPTSLPPLATLGRWASSGKCHRCAAKWKL